MKSIIKIVLLFLSVLYLTISLPPCLAKQIGIFSNQCLLSLNARQIITQEKEFSCPLCIITSQKQLYEKAEQFCLASKEQQQCFHKYFQVLLLNGKISKALQQDYQLFFLNPFKYHGILLQVVKSLKVVKSLQKKQVKLLQNCDSASQLLQLAIVQFYLQKPEESRTSLSKYFTSIDQISQTLSIRLMCRILDQQTKYYDGLNFINQKLKQLQKQVIIQDPYLYHLKGNFLMHHLKFKQAIKQFKQALQLFAINVRYINYSAFKNGFQISNYNIGLCYQKINQPKNAIHYYERVVTSSIDPEAEPLNALGNSYVEKYQKQSQKPEFLSKAKFYYQKSALKDSSYYLAYYNLGYLALLQRNFQQALRMFYKTLELKPDLKSAKYGKLKAYVHLQNKKEAQSIVKQILNQHNEEAVFVQLISILNQLEQNQYALELINQFGQLVKSAQSYEWKGMIQYSLNQFRQAKQSFQMAIFKGSKLGHIYFNLAYCCELLQDYDLALKYYAISNRIQKRQQTKKKVFQIQNIILEMAAAQYGTKQVFQQQL